jgi:hypothetical protein
MKFTILAVLAGAGLRKCVFLLSFQSRSLLSAHFAIVASAGPMRVMYVSATGVYGVLIYQVVANGLEVMMYQGPLVSGASDTSGQHQLK